MVPTAPDWPAWVTTHFDLVSGLFWAPGGPKRAPFGLLALSTVIAHMEPPSSRKRSKTGKKGHKRSFRGPQRSSEGPGGPDLVPTAPDWPAWVGLMVTTNFDLVLGPRRAHFGSNVPNFHGLIFVGYFLYSKYSLVGCPEHHNGTPRSSSTFTAHMEPSTLRKRSKTK